MLEKSEYRNDDPYSERESYHKIMTFFVIAGYSIFLRIRMSNIKWHFDWL